LCHLNAPALEPKPDGDLRWHARLQPESERPSLEEAPNALADRVWRIFRRAVAGSSPAVSNALAHLRSALGDPLVTRQGRGIVPTPRATELAPVIARALRELDAALHEGAFDAATTTRSFTLAIAGVGQIVYAPRIAALLARELPHAHFRVVGVDSLVSLGGVSGSDVDVAFGVPERVPNIHRESLFDELTVLVARAGHAALKSRRALGSLRHVAVEMVPGRGYRDPAAPAYASAGVAREVAVFVPNFSAAAAIVSATDYVATLPRSLFEILRALPGRVPIHSVRMSLSQHARTHTDPAHAAFRALLRRALSETKAKS
jgi:DNA-binding transcriptional LysR family regulator